MTLLYKIFQHKYFTIFVIIFLLLTGNLFYNHYTLHRKMDNTRYVEIIAHQLVLIQKLGDYDRYFNDADNTQVNVINTFNELKSNHKGLLKGDTTLGIHSIVNSEALAIIAAATPFINQIDQTLNGPFKINSESFAKIKNTLFQYSDALSNSIDEFNQDSKIRDNLNIFGQYVFILFSILLIYLSIIFLYLPGEKRLEQTNAVLVRKESKLRALINSAYESNIFLDKDFKVLFFNSIALEKIKQATHKELNIGDDFRQYINPGNLALISDYFYSALQGKKIEVELELPGINSNRWYHILLIPVRNDDHKIMGVSMIRTDITERKNAELSNLEYTKTLKEIVFTESHLLRAPLSNIMGLIDLLMDQTPEIKDLQVKNLISLMKTEVGRIDEVIHTVIKKTNEVNVA